MRQERPKVENCHVIRYGDRYHPYPHLQPAVSSQNLDPHTTPLQASNTSLLIWSDTKMATGLFASLPKPKYTGEHEEVPAHAQPKGLRIVGPGVINESQIVLKVGQARGLS